LFEFVRQLIGRKKINEREFMVWVRKGRKRQREKGMGCRGNGTDMYCNGGGGGGGILKMLGA